ncbi:MAG TPA: DNA polymerase III subunit delta' [Gemmataceae bacterium]|nr:DNA polymerase III subunit delta' [Gemmataceae bacterium]
MSWQRVKGHEVQVRAFERPYRCGRLAHAYLFVGPRGVGKHLFAQELAKSILCEAPPEPARLEACDRCPACQQVEAGSHPDFFTAGRPGDSLELPIEVVRDLCRGFSLKSARGRGKVAILDDADDLNDASANCFLKTLEEPPPRSLFILVGSSPDRQLPTIVSRCQVVRFAPLPDAVTADLLRAGGIEGETLVARLARLSGGSPGEALALADPALWEFRRTLLEALAASRPDSVALGQAWMRFVEEAGKEAGPQRRRAALVLRLLIALVEDALAISLGGTPRLTEAEDLRVLEGLTRRVETGRLLEVLERCLEADAQIDRRVQLALVVEALADALGQLLK